MCMIDGADYAEVIYSRKQKARKPHPCYECRRVIAKGETYLREVTVGDGYAETHKTCLHCLRARGWLQEHCSGFVWGAVADDLHEHLSCSREVKKLVVGMRRFWRTIKGALMEVPA